MSRDFITISKGERREFVLHVAISYLFVHDIQWRISYEIFRTVTNIIVNVELDDKELHNLYFSPNIIETKMRDGLDI
jgi:hypothetical protein